MTPTNQPNISNGEQKMRIKISVKDHQNLQDINIQDLELLDEFNEGLPKVYFKCHKKYEKLFRAKDVIFHDKNGKEFFRSSDLKLEFRYYESDLKLNKVKFSANAIELENLGLLSKTYLRKRLRKSCNAKLAILFSEKTTKVNEIKYWWLQGNRFIDPIRSRMKKCELYKNILIFRYIFKNICQKLITNTLESRAPT